MILAKFRSLRRYVPATGLLSLALAPVFAEDPAIKSYTASVTVDVDQAIGRISPYIYGHYLEHVEREDECIYPSIWDNTSPFADEFGLRGDVIAAARELGVPVVRWPGGCFADVYHWEDGIGPLAERPLRENKHWGGEEPNHFGTDEFLRWCQQVGTEAYINANLGTGTLEECLRWLEYCNGETNTTQGKRREANGHADAYDVTFWGIGNETFGKWEAGNMDAPTYSRTLREWATAVRAADPSVKIMGVGSMSGNNSGWDRAVLEQAGHLIDYLTIHNYGVSTGNPSDYEALAFTPVWFEDRFRRMLAVVDEFADKRQGMEPIRLSLDEWNIRHHRNGKHDRQDPRTMEDAVFAAGVLNSMIRLSPRVAMANYVFLVNGNGVMLVNREQIVKTPLFHVFKQYGDWMQGEALVAEIDAPMIQPPTPKAHYPNYKFPANFKAPLSPYLDAAAALHDDGTVAVALINRRAEYAADVTLNLPSGYVPETVWILQHEDAFAANTFELPEHVVPEVRKIRERKWTCPPHSISLILAKRNEGGRE